MFLAADFNESDNQIICNIPPNRVRINLKDRVWMQSDECRVADEEGNPYNVSLIIIGWSLLHGNIGMRKFEDFVHLLFMPVKPSNRYLPAKCVTSVLLAGNSTQEQFFTYWATLLNNRINPGSVITQTKFASKSFMKTDPVTGQEGEKISYSFLSFMDRAPANQAEEELLKETQAWIKKNRDHCLQALDFPIAGGNFISLPTGCDANKLRQEFYENPLNHHKNLGEANKSISSTLPQGIPDDTGSVPSLPISILKNAGSNESTPF